MKQIVPEYLLNFIEEVYPYEKPKFFGQCLITPAALNKLKTLYNLYSSVKPVNYGERMCPNYIAKMLEEQIFTELTIEDTGYTLETPSKALKSAQLNMVGGMSYKCNQLLDLDNITISTDPGSSVTYTVNADKSITIVNSGENIGRVALSNINIIGITSFSFNSNSTSGSFRIIALNINQNYVNGLNKIENVNYEKNVISLYANANSTITISNIMINSGSTALPYQPYFEGTRDSAITSIAAASTLTIPDEVQSLEGYGQSNPDDSTEYNYIDFNQKKFIQIGYIDENYAWQELDTPVETDISQYIDSNFIDVVPNGTITFNNEYDQAVPYSIDFVVEV